MELRENGGTVSTAMESSGFELIAPYLVTQRRRQRRENIDDAGRSSGC